MPSSEGTVPPEGVKGDSAEGPPEPRLTPQQEEEEEEGVDVIYIRPSFLV
ncbi:hypothetical protein MJA45_09890 [Paenibacillus aurantius]|uniref:Uncharacterized protein n=1 Tax=Paenibacillus aurantius TaxID=2918900 RepID=A0AA96LLQ0_9BACL|nr:hypothetical protein [Paenibacillus aurantius]WNQ14360.1 hypothetical protein MJA45_09890 [Paenibacillus aurantius]